MEDQIDISIIEASKLKKIFEKRFIINLISKHGNKSIPVNFCNKSCNICQPILKTHLEQERIKNTAVPISSPRFQSVDTESVIPKFVSVYTQHDVENDTSNSSVNECKVM